MKDKKKKWKNKIKGKTKILAILAILIISAMIVITPLVVGDEEKNTKQAEKNTNSGQAKEQDQPNTNSGQVKEIKSEPVIYGSESASPKILIYADDYYHPYPNTYIDKALQSLGLSYTAYYDGSFSGFNTALTTGGPWDLVIFGHEEYYLSDATILTNLNNYVSGGGRLIARSWNLDTYASNPLWSTMGITYMSNDPEPPDPVYWWKPSHPILSGVPQFTSLTGSRYQIYGQHVRNSTATTALGGYTTSFSSDHAALVLRNDDKTFFVGFMDGQNDADLDADSVRDGVELWKNAISHMLGGIKPTNMVFVRGSDNALWYRSFDGTSWGGWKSLGGVLSDDPDGATLSGNAYVFVRGTDNKLWYQKFDGTSWSGWTTLGGVLNSAPGASSWSGKIYVFVRGTDNALWYRTYDGASWSGWTSLGGVLTSGPGAS